MANSSIVSDYYKVSFITTRSKNIPSMLKNTGGLIIASDLDTLYHDRSLWFRGRLIASGYGFPMQSDLDNANWAGTYLTYLLGGPDGIGAYAFMPGYIYYGTYGETYYGSSVWDRITTSNTYLLKEINNAYTYAIYAYNSAYLAYTTLSYAYTTLSYNVDKSFENTYSYINQTKDDSYTYTRQWVERILGGSTDILDSLVEISYWLSKDRELGLDTVKSVLNIENTYITHDEPVAIPFSYIDQNGELQKTVYYYTYVSTYSTYNQYDTDHPKIGTYTYYIDYIIGDDGQKIYENDPNYSGNGHEIYHELTYGTYTYYNSYIGIYGMNAMHDYQISTIFNDHKLDDVLKCLIEPYPYKKPSFVISYIGDECTYNKDYIYYIEPKTLSIPLDIVISNNDSYNTYFINFMDFEGGSVGNSLTTLSNLKQHLLFTNVNIDDEYKLAYANILYDDAIPHPYPQLEKLDPPVIDNDGFKKYEESLPSENIVTIKVSDKIFWAEGNSDEGFVFDINIENNSNYGFIVDNKFEEATFSSNSDMLWIAIPKNYDIKCMLIIDKHTHIIQNFLTVISESDVIIETNNTTVRNDIEYNIYQFENKEFLMGSDYKISIELEKNNG